MPVGPRTAQHLADGCALVLPCQQVAASTGMQLDACAEPAVGHAWHGGILMAAHACCHHKRVAPWFMQHDASIEPAVGRIWL